MDLIYLCPTDKKHQCLWEGDMTDIYEHFYSSHEDLLSHTNDILIDLSTKSENMLLLHEEEIYLIQQLVSGKTLTLKLRFLGSHEKAKQINYDIHLETNPTHIVNDLPIISRPGRWEINIEAIQNTPSDFTLSCRFCINNLTDDTPDGLAEITEESEAPVFTKPTICKIHKKYSYNEGSWNTFKTKLTRSVRHRSVIYGDKLLRQFKESDHSSKLPLTLACTKTAEEDSTKQVEFTDQDLPCTTCQKVMLPPIYLCQNKHSICVSCKTMPCGRCNASTTEERNGSLEEISRNFLHACKYASEGCESKLKYNELLNHEIKCPHCTYTCPIENCPASGTMKIFLTHLTVFHKGIKITEKLQNDCPKGSEFFVVNFEIGVFYCTCRCKNESIEWQVFFCGPRERQFFCEIFFKNNRNKDRLYFKRNMERYILRKELDDLKKMKVKDKHAVLEITSYD